MTTYSRPWCQCQVMMAAAGKTKCMHSIVLCTSICRNTMDKNKQKYISQY